MVTVIPALPGWAVIDVTPPPRNGESPHIHAEPIIAWVVDVTIKKCDLLGDVSTSAVQEPVTVHGTNSAHQIVQRPDGSYCAPYDRDFNSQDEMLAYALEDQRKRENRGKPA